MTSDSRYELKFILTPAQHSEFVFWLQTWTQLTGSYPARQVNSIYFDDHLFSCIRENLAGLPDRAKYRIRWYKESGTIPDPNIRFEIKTRRGRTGSKTLFSMDSLKESFFSKTMAELIPEISELLLINDQGKPLLSQQLLPVLYIGYQREYYEDNNGIRATIDQGVHYQPVQLSTRLDEIGGIGNSSIIAELKFGANRKDQVSRMMQHLHLVPKRHSKYLTGMAMAGVTNYI